MDAARCGAGGRQKRPKRLVTAEDYAPYGIGEPDAEGWYPDYHPIPESAKPQAVNAAPTKTDIDYSIFGLVSNWRSVIADLMKQGIDLYDPAVRERPWPGVRTLIFDLIDTPGSRIREALTRR